MEIEQSSEDSYQHKELDGSQWSRLFGVRPEGNFKAVGAVDALHEVDSSWMSPEPAFLEKAQSQSYERESIQLPSLDDLSHLVLYRLTISLDVVQVFNTIINFFGQVENKTINLQEKKLVGFIFDKTNFAEFRVELFRHDGKVGINCQLLEGFAPTLQALWTQLEEALNEEGLIELEEFDDDDDYDFLDSDDEDAVFDLGDASFLNLAFDPSLVQLWIQDLTRFNNMNFVRDTLFLLAYNSGSKGNFDIMQESAQALFDTVVSCLQHATDSLPITRSACIVISRLLARSESNGINVSLKQYNVIVEALQVWAAENDEKDHVTRSSEIAKLISQQLAKLTQLTQAYSSPILKEVYCSTSFDFVKEKVTPLLVV